MTDKTQAEHNASAYLPIADMKADISPVAKDQSGTPGCLQVAGQSGNFRKSKELATRPTGRAHVARSK